MTSKKGCPIVMFGQPFFVDVFWPMVELSRLKLRVAHPKKH